MPQDDVHDRLAGIRRQLDAGQLDAVRAAHARGELNWLLPALGSAGFRRFDEALASGDAARARAELDAADVDVRRISVVEGPTDRAVVVREAAVANERRALAIIVGLVVLAAIAAIVVLALRDDGSDNNGTAADTTSESTTLALTTLAPAPPSTGPTASAVPAPAAATTIAAPTSMAPAATSAPAPAPTAPTPADTFVAPGTSIAPATTAVAAAGPSSTASPASSPSTSVGAGGADVIDTASRSGTFGPFLAMVEAAGLTDQLRTFRNGTAFIPTESAFASLPNDVQQALRSPANQAVLQRIVRYHLLGVPLKAAQLVPGRYTTAEGSELTVDNNGGRTRIGGAMITGPDVVAAGGFLHAVDKLLLPPGLDLSSLGAAPAGSTTSSLP